MVIALYCEIPPSDIHYFMTIATQVASLLPRIKQALLEQDRALTSLTLVAVSKHRTTQDIQEAFNAGITHFGENYWQEAQPKINALAAHPITWHFIGALQRNKARAIAQQFDWIHTVESLDIAERLNNARPPECTPLQICIQINLDEEHQKAGVSLDMAMTIAARIQALPNLVLRGLMMIPKPHSNPEAQQPSFLRLTTALNTMNQTLGLSMDTLSMGMSDDFEAAIHAGSTLIRLGTAIFGPRFKL